MMPANKMHEESNQIFQEDFFNQSERDNFIISLKQKTSEGEKRTDPKNTLKQH